MPKRTTSRRIDDAAVVLTEEFLDNACETYLDALSGERVAVCRLCGCGASFGTGDGGHDETCPIPALERWLHS